MLVRHNVFAKFPVLFSLFFATLWVYGCNNPAPHNASSQPPSPGVTVANSAALVAFQFEHGQQVYGNHCAGCHGEAGKGTEDGPALVGPQALPLQPRPGSQRPGVFHTAMDIAAFATKTMPPDAGDRMQLTEQDYWAVLAFALTANGIKLSEPVGPNNAAQIVLHP